MEATDGPFSDTSFGDDECRLAATFIPGFCMSGTPGRFLFRVLLFRDISRNTQLSTPRKKTKNTKIQLLENVFEVVFCMEIDCFGCH